MEENKNGQLNNDNTQGLPTSGQGANFSTQNTGDSSVGAGNIVGNDTAGIGSGGVVSLQGGKTQREINEQKRIEELKSKAVKLERKLTPREKELERMHREAVKPSTFIPQQRKEVKTPTPDNSNRLTKNWQATPSQATGQREQKLAVPKVDAKKQEELVENLINPVEIEKDNKTQAGVNGENSTIIKKQVEKTSEEKQVKKVVEQKPTRRMVISPAGQISYIDSQAQKEEIRKESRPSINENKEGIKNNKSKASFSENVVDLKAEKIEEPNSQEQSPKNVVAEEKKLHQKPKTPEIPWEQLRVDLSTLTVEDRMRLQATPSLASINTKMDEDLNAEMTEWFEKYNELPANIKLGLGSSEVREKIKELAKEKSIMNEVALGEISRIIRDVYARLIKASDIRKNLALIMQIKDKAEEEALMKKIASIVALVKDIGNKKSEEYFEKLSIKEAIAKYQNIATEEVTTGMLTKKQTGKYVDPTVQNWLDDYIAQMGSGQHTNLERGKYMNDSANTRNLEKQDKQKVERLIKSYDQGSKLILGKEEKSILWNLHEDESSLGINSDKNKRVINKFKIEEAQSTGINEKNDFEKKTNDSIMKDTTTLNTVASVKKAGSLVGTAKIGKPQVGNFKTLTKTKEKFSKELNNTDKNTNEMLDLSSEIPMKK